MTVRSTPSAIAACRRSSCQRRERKGAIVLLAAVLMSVLLGVLALSIDVGYILTAETELQRSVDAGALAGAGLLGSGPASVTAAAGQYVALNPAGGAAIASADVEVQLGAWNELTRSFLADAEGATAVRVSAVQKNRPLFFGRVFGRHQFEVSAEAIATYRPRDIMVVLDFSASMNDDSELKSIPQLGRAAVESNLLEIYRELGSPRFGVMQWQGVYLSSTDARVLRQQLGLEGVPYPYPSGSWDDYFRYVQTSSSVSSAGYNKRYGYLTLVNYWLERQPMYSQTPDLWQVSAQPVTAVKDAVSLFLAYLSQAEADDRVGLVVYTSADGAARLESSLTTDFGQIEQITRQRQAGHYDPYTNIGAGMQVARTELQRQGRPGALKMIVLMTDGIANRPVSTSVARQLVQDEARRAAEQRFPIISISLGAAADQALMQGVADTTAGVHFNIPGGQSVAAYEADLKDVFRRIADDRPLKLVK